MAAVRLSKIQDLDRKFTDNINRNRKLEHIKYVEAGLKSVDDNYREYKKIEKHLQTLEKYEKYLEREKEKAAKSINE